MDEEKLHNDLKARISEVFDNYEDTSANEGWLLLCEKFPRKEKHRGLGWLWYAAAALVLLFPAIWLISGTGQNKPDIVRTKKSELHIHQEVTSPAYPDTAKNGLDKLAQATPPVNNLAKPIISSLPLKIAVRPINTMATPNADAYSKTNTANPPIAQNNGVLNNQPAVTNPLVNNQADGNSLHKLADSMAKNNIPVKRTQPAQLPGAVNKQPTYNLFVEKSRTDNGDKEQEKTGKKTVISIYAATYFNYAKGSDNQVNVGAGFTSDFHITNKLKLSTGLAIAQNTLNYSKGNLPNPAQNEQGFSQLAASAAVASGTPITGNGTASSLVRFETTLRGTKNYSANLVGLDIPVNLKFEFNPQKNDTYIAAGVSSGTFINETYRSVYTYSQVSKESSTHSSFRGFDVAKTLNFSFGVGYPLGKTNRLIVEPFLKYPLDGLGAQQIRFGAGGVNLRLNLHSLKNKDYLN